MTAPTQHPSEDLIVDLARGALEPGRALVVRAHLGVCPDCQASLRLAEAIGGAMIEDMAPAEMAPDALGAALARLDAQPPPTPPAKAAEAPDNWIRVPPDILDAARRSKRWAAPGVWVAPVTRKGRSGPRSYLLGIGPGIAVPQHTHRGSEFICVLKGSFEDRGEVYRAGDFIESDEAVEHRPRVTMEGECVCLVAADYALVPRSLTARLFQPFVGI